jgi:hypothetical protein
MQHATWSNMVQRGGMRYSDANVPNAKWNVRHATRQQDSTRAACNPARELVSSHPRWRKQVHQHKTTQPHARARACTHRVRVQLFAWSMKMILPGCTNAAGAWHRCIATDAAFLGMVSGADAEPRVLG